jgi:hypothetical protein
MTLLTIPVGVWSMDPPNPKTNIIIIEKMESKRAIKIPDVNHLCLTMPQRMDWHPRSKPNNLAFRIQLAPSCLPLMHQDHIHRLHRTSNHARCEDRMLEKALREQDVARLFLANQE